MDAVTYGFLSNFTNVPSLNSFKLSKFLNIPIESSYSIIQDLLKNGYIKPVISLDEDSNNSFSLQTQFSITYAGTRACVLYEQSQKHFQYSEFRAWITLAIALISLILSVINTFRIFV